VLTPSCMVFTKGILPGHQDIYIYISEWTIQTIPNLGQSNN